MHPVKTYHVSVFCIGPCLIRDSTLILLCLLSLLFAVSVDLSGGACLNVANEWGGARATAHSLPAP